MATAVRESRIEDIQPSSVAATSVKDLKPMTLVGNPTQCYRATVWLGPHVSWSGMSGLGSKNGWDIKPDPSDSDRVIVDPKYAAFDITVDGTTADGLIQGHNEFLEALGKNQPGTNKVAQADLSHMLAVKEIKPISGKLVGVENMFFGRIDKDLLKAYIAQEVIKAMAERDSQDAADLAAKKAKVS